MRSEQAFFCMDCESIEKPVTTQERLQCPRCGSRAIHPIIAWVNPYRCGDCGHIGRPITTDTGLRCERCKSINVQLHVVRTGYYAAGEEIARQRAQEACHA